MKKLNITKILIVASMFFVAFNFSACKESDMKITKSDALPSWNDNATKKAIVDYVKAVTEYGSPDFIPKEDRIATFDNDGTLWAEQPVVQILFVFDHIKTLAKTNPKLKEQQPFKAVIDDDYEAMKHFTEKDVEKIFIASQSNISLEDYQKTVADFMANGTYPGRNVKFSAIRYQPQMELLQYLRENNFKIYICSGGTTDFMRVFSKDFYNVEPENVIGSSNNYKYSCDSTGKCSLILLPELFTLNNKETKAENIMRYIGKYPVLACGNEGGAGDVYMLLFSQQNKYKTLQLIVNHDDKTREYEYSENPDVSLTMANKHNWTVISIKNDWKTVFTDK